MKNRKQKLVEFILNYMEDNFNYLILRNYENLPFDEGHDIDLLISNKELNKTNLLIQNIRSSFDVTIYKREKYYGLRGYVIIINGEILHLDFFYYIQWNRCLFLDTDTVLKNKVRFQEKYWIIDSNDLGYYCWINFIVNNGKIKEKYIRFALEWNRNNDNRPSNINIEKNNNDNKKHLLCFFLRKTPLRTIGGIIKNVLFKIKMLFNMDGRIYVDNQYNSIIEKCSKFCACNQYVIKSATDIKILNILKMLYHETAIYIENKNFDKSYVIKFLLKKYIIYKPNNLETTIGNIYHYNEEK
jgi:hypothetical protein